MRSWAFRLIPVTQIPDTRVNAHKLIASNHLNEKQVSFTCERLHLFNWEAIISNLQLCWFSDPGLTAMLRLVCSQSQRPFRQSQWWTSLQSRCPGSSSHPVTSADMMNSGCNLVAFTTERPKSNTEAGSIGSSVVNGLQRCAVGVDSVCSAANNSPPPLTHRFTYVASWLPEGIFAISAWRIHAS